MTAVQDWHPIYQELNRIVGETAALALHEQFGGTQVTFPKRLLAKDAEARQILVGYQRGLSLVELARNMIIRKKVFAEFWTNLRN